MGTPTGKVRVSSLVIVVAGLFSVVALSKAENHDLLCDGYACHGEQVCAVIFDGCDCSATENVRTSPSCVSPATVDDRLNQGKHGFVRLDGRWVALGRWRPVIKKDLPAVWRQGRVLRAGERCHWDYDCGSGFECDCSEGLDGTGVCRGSKASSAANHCVAPK